MRSTPVYIEASAGMWALGRVGLPDDIGPVVARLIGSNSRWTTDQRIEVTGDESI